MKRILGFILIISAFAPASFGLNFKQVSYIPLGINDGQGYIKGTDINRDDFQDLAFSTQFLPMDGFRIAYCGYRPYNRYVFEDSSYQHSLFWDIGDLDGDSLIDVVGQGDSFPSSIRVFEPTDYWSFPKVRVWNWPREWIGNAVQPMYITDLDQDGLKEILTADDQVIYVFENRGNNQYQKVWCDTVRSGSINVVPTGSFAFGDFDGDGQMEFAVPTYGGNPADTTVFVYKCTGNDQYQRAWGEHLNTANMYDCISLPNIKGDGKTDFMVGSLKTGIGQWYAQIFIYEVTGINQYHVIFSDSVPATNRGHYTCHSDCGDVDGDGRPELVWAIDRTWMVYKYDSLSQRFQRIYTAWGVDNGHVDTNIHIHDMNGNGYQEIIESGGGDAQGHVFGETHIWEVEAVELVYPNGGETLYGDSLAVIRWRNVDPFRADSFSLFFSSDSGLSYTPIVHGIPGIDSTYLWTVPDTVSTKCFIMLWAYQNATGWDFSDGPFTVRRPNGVEVSSHVSLLTCLYQSPRTPLSLLPGHPVTKGSALRSTMSQAARSEFSRATGSGRGFRQGSTF